MNALFGIPTSNIMVVLVALFALAVGTVVAIGLGNRTMFRLGLRNLPRRGTQTVLVVAGLTLSTLIVTAAFVTGDTIDYSFTKSSYDLLQRSDIDIAINGEHQLSTNGGLAVDGPTEVRRRRGRNRARGALRRRRRHRWLPALPLPAGGRHRSALEHGEAGHRSGRVRPRRARRSSVASPTPAAAPSTSRRSGPTTCSSARRPPASCTRSSATP